jgi:hypothetical protein
MCPAILVKMVANKTYLSCPPSPPPPFLSQHKRPRPPRSSNTGLAVVCSHWPHSVGAQDEHTGGSGMEDVNNAAGGIVGSRHALQAPQSSLVDKRAAGRQRQALPQGHSQIAPNFTTMLVWGDPVILHARAGHDFTAMHYAWLSPSNQESRVHGGKKKDWLPKEVNKMNEERHPRAREQIEM